jgi:hypothetical protein
MSQAMRNALIALLALVLGACVRLGHIQQTDPVRMLKFSGSMKTVAECIQQRLGGKLEQPLGDRYVVYDAVKGMAHEGLTHYAITLRRTPGEESIAEWRIMRTPRHGTSTGSTAPPRLSEQAVEQFWTPVQDCAARAKSP